jgi:hypothetical protein
MVKAVLDVTRDVEDEGLRSVIRGVVSRLVTPA